jgi:hypothetical protein
MNRIDGVIIRYLLPGKCCANHRRPERKSCFCKIKFGADPVHGKKPLEACASNHPESKKPAFAIASGRSAVRKTKTEGQILKYNNIQSCSCRQVIHKN